MGRKKKYHTKEELIEANKKWCTNYYEKNKEVLKEKARKRYYERKNRDISN